jgi:hypothetical protein
MSTAALPSDEDIPRNRPARLQVLFGAAIAMPIAGSVASSLMASTFFANGIVSLVGGVIGFGGGIIGFIAAKPYFFVSNPTTGTLVTIDRLRSFFGWKDIYTTYGPGGPYPAFPWEKRLAENNISTKEATNTFKFVVQCTDGILNGSGSYRLQPDIRNPQAFLNGVAAVADDIRSLMVAKIVSTLSGKSILDATLALKDLNDILRIEFAGDGHTPTKLENRFGIYIGDVTIDELLPSDDVQRTIAALSEAEVIAKGTAILLNRTVDEVKQTLANGTLTHAEYERAQRTFMSVSGNMEGIEIKRFEVDLSGVDKDTATAIAAFLRSMPPGFAQNLTKGASKK